MLLFLEIIIENEKLFIINKISILKQFFKYLLQNCYNISSLDSLFRWDENFKGSEMKY